MFKNVLTIDEEISGITGFMPFVSTKEFKSLKIGLALDEGKIISIISYY